MNKTLVSIEKEFLKKCNTGYGKGGFVIGSLKNDSAEMDFEKIKSFYRQQILALIEEIEGENDYKQAHGVYTVLPGSNRRKGTLVY